MQSIFQTSHRTLSETKPTMTSHTLPTPPLSRSSSVSSTHSEQGWADTISKIERGRQPSNATTTSASSQKSGFRSLFSKSKSEKPKKPKKDMDQIIITSRHAAAVKTKMMLDPHYKSLHNTSPPKTASVVGTQHSIHLTAAAQEMRHPHSGPPALQVGTTAPVDMPLLSRIVSGDEHDEEDELERSRKAWTISQFQAKGMERVVELQKSESSDDSDDRPSSTDSDTSPDSMFPARVVYREGTRLIAADLDASPTDDLQDWSGYESRPSRFRTTIGGRWNRNDNGVWTR